jgi:hypothetical protein
LNLFEKIWWTYGKIWPKYYGKYYTADIWEFASDIWEFEKI